MDRQAAYITEQLKLAGYAVESVQLTDASDRSTWRVLLARGATVEQQQAANEALAALVVTPTVLEDREIAASMQTLDYAVIIVYLAQMQRKTVETVQAEITAIAKQLRAEMPHIEANPRT